MEKYTFMDYIMEVLEVGCDIDFYAYKLNRFEDAERFGGFTITGDSFDDGLIWFRSFDGEREECAELDSYYIESFMDEMMEELEEKAKKYDEKWAYFSANDDDVMGGAMFRDSLDLYNECKRWYEED